MRTATAAAVLFSAVMVQAAGRTQIIVSAVLTPEQAQGMTLNDIYAYKTSRGARRAGRQHGG